MRSILGVGDPIDLSQSKDHTLLPKESKAEPSLPGSLSIPRNTTATLVKTNPVVHSIDQKLMNSMKSDFGSLYRRHFSGLEVPIATNHFVTHFARRMEKVG